MFLHFIFYTFPVPEVQQNFLYWIEGVCCCVGFFHMGFTFSIPTWAEEITDTLASFCYQKDVQKFCDTNAILPAPKTEPSRLTSFWRKKSGNISV